MTILDAMTDRNLFAPWFVGDSWAAWKVLLAGLFGLPMTAADLALWQAHTGRTDAPTTPAREGWLVIGRRGGKSITAALVAVWLACFRDYGSILARGERGTVMVIACDRRQARTVLRYVMGFLDGIALLRPLIVRRTREAVDLSNGITIEVHVASFRSVRGYTLLGAICDEIAFWSSSESSASPDAEVLSALRPAMLTVPGALLLCISSPYARRGTLWSAYRSHYGRADGPVIWQASTAAMNPCVDAGVIAEAFEADPASAHAEYGAQFRSDVETYISIETVEAAVVPDQRERAPRPEYTYVAFVDPSGGSQDSMTLAIAHAEEESDGRVILVLDLVREIEPPFSPEQAVADLVEALRTYRVTRIAGDRYGGEWPRERFRQHGIAYDVASRTKNELYRDILPYLNSQAVELLDVPRLHAQLLGLERRTGSGGRDVIDHPPSGHDDLVNSTVGALLEAGVRARRGQEVLVW